MEINTHVCNNELRKIGMLITKASELDMDVSGYGCANVNKWSGNVYLYLEDYPFTLYIGLSSDDIYALWSNPEDGEEVEVKVDNMTLTDLENWANDLYNQADEA